VTTLTAGLASQNAHKLRELQAALPDWKLRLLPAASYPPETGETHAENARAKARFGHGLATGDEWVLGEDSGLEVEALDGGPGLKSARWAGDEHVSRLLEALNGSQERAARYVCELIAIAPDGTEFRGRGELSGRIAVEPSGGEGFGFDPIFVPDGESRTVAELGDEWKTRKSHRARAARALVGAVSAAQASPGAS